MSKPVFKIIVSTAIVSLWQMEVAAEVPRAGEPFEVQIGQGGAPPLIFRYCPAGKLRPGKPKPKSDEVDKPGGPPLPQVGGGLLPPEGPVDTGPFYITETEIAIPQFKQVVDAATFEALQTRVAKLTGKPDLVAAVNSGRDFPVFGVTILEAANFCKRLTDRLKGGTVAESLEARRCRLPSHREWQYACRARTDPDVSPTLPHFNRWPENYEALDKVARATCIEEWKELGKAEADFQGTQEQVAAILERQSSTNSKPLDILSAFLKAGLGTRRNYAENRPGQLLAGRTVPPNAWNIYDMHENVREWVIATSDPAELFEYWNQITRSAAIGATARDQKLLFLAGGGFDDLMFGQRGAWQKFTIWGGYPIDLGSGGPAPFSIGDAAANDIAFDEDPGFRVVLERVLRDDWLLVVRRLAIEGDLAKLRPQNPFDRYRVQIADLVPAKLRPALLARLDYYESMAAYRDGRKSDAKKHFSNAKPGLIAHKQNSKLADLADLVGGNAAAPKAEAEKPTEEDVFLSRLETLLLADAAAD